MFLNFFVDGIQNIGGDIFSQKGKVVCILACKAEQMLSVPAGNSFPERLRADKLQHFLLVGFVVQIGCKMHKPEQKIIQVQVDIFVMYATLLHFGEQMVYFGADAFLLIQFNGGNQLIQGIFAQNGSFLRSR